jgi:6-phosphogluconolactonase
MMKTAIICCGDRADIAMRARDLLISQLSIAIARRGQAHLALTGGSSASALFALLRSDERSRRVDWHEVHVWQGDERFVSPGHEDANWAVARREWLEHGDGPRIPADRFHNVPVEEALAERHDEVWAAERYSADIERLVPKRNGIPAFDVILLGIGGDGHIMSTFPGTAPIGERERPAMAVAAPTHIEPHQPRVTLSPFLFEAAGLIVAMVPGAGKAEIIAEVLGPERDVQRWPAQLALRPNAVWLLEPDSAARLTAS